MTALRVGILATHPVQYYAPWYRALARLVDLDVFFSHRQTSEGQARAGFGVAFEWDVPVLEGYRSTFLRNTARHPDVSRFWGCVTPELSSIITRGRFDAFIVQGWMTASYLQAIRACKRTGTPILVRGDSHLATPRSPWLRAVKWPAYRWLISQFDGYLVVGSRARAYVLHYGARADRCFDAPHSVDNQFFASHADAIRHERPSLRRECGVPEDGPAALFVGKLIDGKAADVFIESVARAAAHTSLTGLIVGDGPLRPTLEALARRLNAPVRFAGFLNQTQLVRAYAMSDVLVVPSVSETWGLVINEAMASGLPAVVSSGVGAADDLVLPGRTGDVFPVGDVNALSTILVRVASDATYRAALGRNARAHICRFDTAATAAGTVHAIETILAGSADPAAQALWTQPN